MSERKERTQSNIPNEPKTEEIHAKRLLKSEKKFLYSTPSRYLNTSNSPQKSSYHITREEAQRLYLEKSPKKPIPQDLTRATSPISQVFFNIQK